MSCTANYLLFTAAVGTANELQQTEKDMGNLSRARGSLIQYLRQYAKAHQQEKEGDENLAIALLQYAVRSTWAAGRCT